MTPLVISIVTLLIATSVPTGTSPVIPKDVEETIRARVKNGYAPSIVIGVIDENGSTVMAHGWASRERLRKVDADTVYEIGSITKAFTGILLADMVNKGEVALDDPISKHLPTDIDTPTKDDKEITLLTLSNHTSGLPRLPTNMVPDDSDNPYASYSPKDLYEFLDGYVMEKSIGIKYEYSNLGAGLLGQILSRVADQSYEQLVWQRIAKPLGMTSTMGSVRKESKPKEAQGYTGAIEVGHWDIPTLAGAGDLVSSANDMLKFVAANLCITNCVMEEAMTLSHKPTTHTSIPNTQVGLGWHIRDHKGRKLIWHNGGTGGFRSFVGFAPDKKFGVVVLTNTGSLGVDDIGFHTLEPGIELETRWDEPTVKVDEKTLNSYVGYYELSPGFIMDVQTKNGMLTVEPTGQQVFTLYAKSKTEFFLTEVEAAGEFVIGDDGKVSHLIWKQGGAEQKGMRKDSFTPPPPKKEIEVSAEILKQYVGKYELAPSVIFDVTLKEDQLYVQLTGQPSLPVYPESEDEFFYKVVTASIKFHIAKGKTFALTLKQGGQNQLAKRLPDKDK
ncbi:MAG: penicillin-binding protein [Phycisphaerae bacterium]|nr:MAG: penicillin-binding protein [Phycisphaerae bacterium]